MLTADTRFAVAMHCGQCDAKKNSKQSKRATSGVDNVADAKIALDFFRMPTPLLAFLNDVEDALRREFRAQGKSEWEISRIVNYHHGLARMTLTPPPDADEKQKRGAIFLQNISDEHGALCFKVNLNWHGSDAFPVITVRSTRANWNAEADSVAAAWLAGPPASFPPFGSQAEPQLTAID